MIPEEIENLIQKYLDNTLSVSEKSRLEAALLESEAARSMFWDSAGLHGDLRTACLLHAPTSKRELSQLAFPSGAETTPAPLAPAPPAPPTAAWKFWFSAMAMGLAVAIGIILFGQKHKGPSESVTAPIHFSSSVAYLVYSEGVDWVSNPRKAGEMLEPGNLNISSGKLLVGFYCGAKMLLDGPGEVQLITPGKAQLAKGRVRVHVPEQAKGFTLLGPQFELVDLGTEFAMEITEDERSQVLVYDGEVTIQPKNKKRQSFLTGQCIEILRSGLIQDVDRETFPFIANHSMHRANSIQRKNLAWQEAMQKRAKDPRVVLAYDFHNEVDWYDDLKDLSDQRHGTIVGCEWSQGRWPGKSALSYRRSGDRVRIAIPDDYDNITLTAWVKIQDLNNQHNSLLMSDGFESGEIHWMISSVDNPEFYHISLGHQAEDMLSGHTHSTPEFHENDLLDRWLYLSAVIGEGRVYHYVNGLEVSSEKRKFNEQKIRIGNAELGNWTSSMHETDTPNRNFNGRMDEVVIYNEPLSAEEIAELYENGLR